MGAGQAGAEAANALRQQGYAGSITLIGDESYPPYRRPPLSKAFLSGAATQESLYLKPLAAYATANVDCRLGIGVEAIDREAHCLRLFDGTSVPYAQLILATGGRARRLSLPGADAPNVHYVRGIDDILAFKDQMVEGKRLVIIGGGYIGLETAAVAVQKGLSVTVVEAAPRLLARVAVPEVSAFYERAHTQRGVSFRIGVGIHGFEGEGQVDTVVLADGSRLAADFVVAGIGLIPNTELAEAAGLTVSNGVAVDAYTRSSDPDIYAIGDCSHHENQFLGRRLRLESVPNAMEQARVVAATIVGKPQPYAAVPWFWSDQYDLKLQMVGLSEGHDRFVVRGDLSTESFCIFYLKDGLVISADAVNRPQDFVAARRIVGERIALTPEQLADESQPLKALLPPMPARAPA